MSMVRYSRKELNEKFSDKQDAEIQRLLAKGTVPDDQLDLSDIPEVTDWSNAVRHNQFYRPVKQQKSDRKSTRLNSSHRLESRMPSSA